MKKLILLFAALLMVSAQKPESAVPSFSEPAISPDGSEIAFVSAGDIWTVPAKGGEARLLVAHPATESRPMYSPDGTRLAFVSTRTGGGDIYVLTLATGNLARITYSDTNDQLDGWSRDGRWIYFDSSSQDIAGMNDVFRVSAEGGTPMAVTADRYTNEYYAAASPDGTSIAFVGRGYGSAQWWRNGHSHIDESEIWIMRDGSPATYQQVTGEGAKDLWPMWAPDGKTLYYMSDRSGAQNIWTATVGGKPAQVTSFKDGRVLWPTISNDGRTIVFERNFGIWKLDTRNKETYKVEIALRGTPEGTGIEHLRVADQVRDMALSPDGRKVAYTVHGEVFAASARDGGDAFRVTGTPELEAEIVWLDDSRRVIYASDRDGPHHLYLYDFTTGKETRLTNDAKSDVGPVLSPDGKALAFFRGGRELRVMDLESKQDRVVATGEFPLPPSFGRSAAVWSPDSQWLAYTTPVAKSFDNVFVVPAAGGKAEQISFLPNGNTGGLSWSPDGTFIILNSSQRTEPNIIARIDLAPRTAKFREDQFKDLFKDEPQARGGAQGRGARPGGAQGPQAERKAPPKVNIVFEGIRERLSILSPGVEGRALSISPDGKWLLISSGGGGGGFGGGQSNYYLYPLDELSRQRPTARQLTTSPGAKSDPQFTSDSRELFYVEGGRITYINLDNRQARSVSVTSEMDVDFAREKMEVFRQAWTYLRDGYWDSTFHGLNWDAVRAQYEPVIAGARTPDEMRRAISFMLGDLNGSHLGISGPRGGGPAGERGAAAGTGRLGLRFDRKEYESAGKLKITEVIPLGPSAVTGQIHTGDYIEAVDGTPAGARVSLDELLAYKSGKKVTLTISDGSGKREVAVEPVSTSAEKQLVYRAWVEANRAYVAKISNGRLGYVHMIDMSQNALTQFYLDLDSENHERDGVVIDVRNNNGGFVNAYAIDVLARRPYLTMTPRGSSPAPARPVLGQRALERPTILVINRHSLSDAEDFTEGYRALKLGKVVGEPTAGWIVYTGSATLIDGSSLRMPGTRVTDNNGQTMEMNPRPVDIRAIRPLGESYTGKDTQLETAVRELLAELGAKK
jgi:tricorn protease